MMKRARDIETQFPLVVKPRQTVLVGLRASVLPVGEPVNLDAEDPACSQLPPPIIPLVSLHNHFGQFRPT